MRFNDPLKSYDPLLRDGIRAAKDGNKSLAWRLLTQASELNPMDARPWLWLTETTDDPAEKLDYLEKAVAAEPGNVTARRALAVLKGKIDPSKIVSDSSTLQQPPSDEPVKTGAKTTYLCPQCGAHMEYNIQTEKLTCLYCGFIPQMGEL